MPILLPKDVPQYTVRRGKKQAVSEQCEKNEKWKTSKILGISKPGGYRPYKLLSLCLGVPLIIAHTIATIVMEDEKEKPPFVKYSHLRIRTKKFPWGEGDKSLFHNPKRNALPDGYEEE